MIALFKFRSNDLNPSKGRQIEFNSDKVANFFEFTNSEENVIFQYKSLDSSGLCDGQIIKVYLKLSPSRGDYKIYQNLDGSLDLKDFFLNNLGLDSTKNIDDFFALRKVTNLKYILYYIPQGKEFSVFYNQCIHNDLILENKESKSSINHPLTSLPLQKITYGAPGTGKSYETNRVTREYPDTIRTTFHPDSDYSTFVGSYKPTTTKEPVLGLNGTTTVKLIDPSTGKPLETTKIVYKFIKQAFLKAYIRAWKKMCVVKPRISASASFTYIGKVIYTITAVTIDEVICMKEKESFSKSAILSVWDSLWQNGKFVMPEEGQSEMSIQQAISKWIYDLPEVNTKDDFELGWAILISQLKEAKTIKVKKDVTDAQSYILTYDEDTQNVQVDSLAISREAIQKCYNGEKSYDSVKEIADRLKKFDSQSFGQAWESFMGMVTNMQNSEKPIRIPISVKGNNPILEEIEPQFLVIEEINRGNCAQIFGDIFQLLDRKLGYSEYPIEADEDIQKALLDENPDDGLSFGKDGLTLPEEVKNELRQVFEGDANPDAIIKKICMGKVLVLPRNLHIWATMNTSDQSLFPIDSAFKRRWDWEYVPIKNHTEENWKIKIENETYDWWKFLVKVNNIINELTSSEDKKLGYFFAKAQNKVVDTNTMVNKVFFYLWNDIFKDFDLNHSSIDFPKIKDNDKERPYAFGDFFSEEGEISVSSVSTFMKELVPEANETPTASGSAATEETEKTEEPEELSAE